MKKGILCIVLSILLLVPMFASCSQTSEIVGTDAPVYTLYTICEEETKEEDITKVELALNRILFYRSSVILKLEMVTADKYAELIEQKYKEVEEYQEALKNGEINTDDQPIYTGDEILSMLEKGEEIPLKQPRLDIFLVQGYDEYYELATKNEVAALDEMLNNEAKALKSNIHSTLFNAAKVNNKVYGIPVNNTIGEYSYFVFDTELLDKYGLNPNTIESLEDLQDYLEVIKANEKDVVPLKSAVASTKYTHLVEEGFPVLADEKHNISLAYDNLGLKNYFAMIARYNKLGYIGSAEDSEDTRYAVRIETGKKEDLEKLYEGSTCVLFSAPLATNETAVSNIFCVSKFVVSNELTAVMKTLSEINTDAVLMNLLTYGVENEHYTLTDDGQVERLNNNYLIDPKHIGNAFITKTLVGDDKDKWNYAIKQNQDAIASPSLGFTPAPNKFSYIEDGVEKYIEEPDYYGAISSVVAKYYPTLISGTFDFDYDAIYKQAETDVFNTITSDLESHYENEVLRPKYSEQIREDITNQRGEILYQEAMDEVMTALIQSTTSNLKNSLTNEYKSKNPNATQAEINDYVTGILTDDYILEKVYEANSKEAIEKMATEVADFNLEAEITAQIDSMSSSAGYKSDLKALLNSARFKNELQALKDVALKSEVITTVDKYIAEKITTDIINVMIDEINVELEALVDNFYEENKEILGFADKDDLLKQLGYLIEEIPETEPEEGEEVEPVFSPKYETWFEFVYNDKIVTVYTSIFGQTAA